MKSAGQPPRYTLFGTSACHLCEVAEGILDELCRGNVGIQYEKVDISASAALLERYGLTIPVLRDPAGRELNWPFTAAQVRRFVKQPTDKGC